MSDFDSQKYSFFSKKFFKEFIFFINERHRERQRHRQRHREKQAPCRELNAGFNPRSTGSRLGLKADAQPLSHPGVPELWYFIQCF